jgi:hypothetical protein
MLREREKSKLPPLHTLWNYLSKVKRKKKTFSYKHLSMEYVTHNLPCKKGYKKFFREKENYRSILIYAKKKDQWRRNKWKHNIFFIWYGRSLKY